MIYGFYKQIKIKIKQFIHPFLFLLMQKKIDFDLICLNIKPNVEGTVLYCVSHNTCHDAPVTGLLLKEHFVILVGKQRLKIADRLFFHLNEVIMVDRKNKKSREKSAKAMIWALSHGHNLVTYPEQTWCLSDSIPINPISRGTIKIARETGATIIPISLDYRNEGKVCYAEFGKPMYFLKDEYIDILQKTDELTDQLATMKWLLWESFPVEQRTGQDMEQWEREKKRRLAEYPLYNCEQEKTYVISYKNTPDIVLGIRKPFSTKK